MNLKHIASQFVCAGRFWSADNASTSGAALAFYSAFSLGPLLVIVLTLAGWVVGQTTAYSGLESQLNSLFGPATARILLGAVKSSQRVQGGWATLLSVLTLMVSATTVLAALETALDKIWKSRALVKPGVMGWLRARFLSLGFILTLGFLLLISLTLSTGLAAVQERFTGSEGVLAWVVTVLDTVISMLLVAALFTLIYRYMPARKLPWRPLIIGGVLTALLFNVGRWSIGLYLARSTEPSAFGAAASFAALLLWLYYSAQIFLFGAEFTACLAGVRQEDAARQRTPERNRGLPNEGQGAPAR